MLKTYSKPTLVLYICSLAVLLYIYATANGLVLPIQWKKQISVLAKNVSTLTPTQKPSPTSTPSPTPTPIILPDVQTVGNQVTGQSTVALGSEGNAISQLHAQHAVETVTAVVQEKIMPVISALPVPSQAEGKPLGGLLE